MRAHRVVALGDSFSCGEGVGLRVPPSRTWVSLLARALGAEVTCLARPGARVADARAGQVGPAVQALREAPAGGALVTVLLGLNDVAARHLDVPGLRTDLRAVVGDLRSTGARLLLVRLHDPCRVAAVPPPLRGRVARRVEAVNAVLDELTAPGDALVDLAALPELSLRAAWALDRLHPAEGGHVTMARAALRALGVQAAVRPEAATGHAPHWTAELGWTLRHGLPWLVTHLGRVAPAALRAAPDPAACSVPEPERPGPSQARVAARPASASALR